MNFTSSKASSPPAPAPSSAVQVRFAPGVFAAGEPGPALLAQFPQVRFSPLNRRWEDPGADVLMVAADAADASEIDLLCIDLRESGRAGQVIVLLSNADLESTRRLVREGVFDVLAAPAGDTALTVSLERLLLRLETEAAQPRSAGKVVAFLKAGGGVGATTIATQLATLLAARDRKLRVCLADLDVQSGSAAVYLDLQDTVTMSQVLAAGKALSEIRFSDALVAHGSGVRVLGDPQEFIPLEALQPAIIESLVATLRRDFDVVLLDMPPVWMSWTDRALRQVDQIVLVTHLSVPHANLTRRQLKVLASQHLDVTPLTLVCNSVGQGSAGVSLKAMEKAVGRSFDAVLPEDQRLVSEAINQGVAIGAIRRGTKLEKAMAALADTLGLAPVTSERRRP